MNIKKHIAILMCTSMLLISVGCNNESTYSNEIQTDKVNVGQDVDDLREIPADNGSIEVDTTGMYHVVSKDSWILIPEEYILFTRDMDESSDALKAQGLSKSDLVSYLDAYGSEFVAITPDGNMEVMLKFTKTGFGSDNLISQSEDVISGYAEGLQIGFNAEQYELIENNDMMWVKLAYSHSVIGETTPADYVRYATIANGWDIYLWGASYNGKLTSQNLHELQGMWNSFFFSK